MSLLFALIALAALSLAAVALVRSVDTGGRVIGNLGFKQDATSASDRATEQAIAWLTANQASLNGDALGYYANSLETLDPTGRVTSAAKPLALVNWDADGCPGVPAGTYTNCGVVPSGSTTVGGNTSMYLIMRLCPTAGPPSAVNVCAKPLVSSPTTASTRGRIEVGSQTRAVEPATSPYFRIIVRTVGGRRAVSFTETIVHF